MLQLGTVVERYRVEALLGQGGMAAVYRVRHESLNTLHALKVLSIDSKSVRARLLQEGQVQAGLRHPNIVEVRDVLDVAGAPGLLMEYVEGVAMDAWLDAHKPTVDEALAIFRGVLAGIGHAHAEGLIHRDLKPANIMLSVGESEIVPKIADFGLAKLIEEPGQKHTRTGTTMGTPEYMPPEQIRDASSVDRRADLYALGCILYELFCGQTPFRDDDLLELFAKVRSGEFPPPEEVNPDIPVEVARCIRLLVKTDPAERIADCASILQILDGGDAPPSGDTLARARRVAGSASFVSIHSPGGEVAVRLTAEHQRATAVPAPSRRPPTSGETVAQSLFTEPLPPTTEAPLPPRQAQSAPPEPPPPLPPAENNKTGLGLVVVAGLFVLMALALVAIPVAVWGLVALREPATINTPLSPDAVPVNPEPGPPPEPVTPEPVEPPTPEPVEEPEPPAPEPEPTAPAPTAPAPTAPVTVEPGRFAVTGARSAWLTVKGRKRRPGDTVEPGSWPLTVTLDGVPTALPMAEVAIRPGETTRIACIAKMKLCRQEK